MRCLKKTLSLLLAVVLAVSSAIAFFPSAGSEAKAAGNQYEYISLEIKEQYLIKYTKEVQNGNYYITSNGDNVQVKDGKGGTYKITDIKTNPSNGFAGNGKFLYYIEKTSKGNVLKRYNYKTSKIEKIKKLPESSRNNAEENEVCHILGTCGDYIFFCSYNDTEGHGDAVMYSFNVKNKKIKKAGIKGFGREQSNGKYFIAEKDLRTYVKPTSYSLYKFTKKGTVKKIKGVSKNTVEVFLYNDSLYWVGISKNTSSPKNVLYTMKIDGTGKKKLATSSKKYQFYGVNYVDDSGIYMRKSDLGHDDSYKYMFKTRKIKNI